MGKLEAYYRWKEEAQRTGLLDADIRDLYCCKRCDYYKLATDFEKADTKLGHATICRVCVKQDKLDEKERRKQESQDWLDMQKASLEAARRAGDADILSSD